MSDLPPPAISPPAISPHHNGGISRRHRFWAVLVVVALCAAALVVTVDLFSTGPTDNSPTVAVSLPPEGGVTAPPPSVAPSAGMPETGAQPPTQPSGAGNAPSTQTAMLPPRPETKTPTGGQPAWLRFATTAPVDIRDKPRIAIVIDDLGLDRPRTERVIALAPAVTLSFLAYSGDLPRLTEMARRAGHEMIVHVPMQPVNAKIDMGPNGLSTNQPKEEVLRRLDWDLGRFDGYVGINNHMGSRFTGDAQAMGWVMDELKTRGLMFLDSRTIAGSIGAKAASAVGVPFAERDIFLDDERTAGAVDQQFKEVEAIARKKGTAIAIGHPHDVTIAALTSWIASLPQKGFVLVPLTEIVKARLGLS